MRYVIRLYGKNQVEVWDPIVSNTIERAGGKIWFISDLYFTNLVPVSLN